MQNGRFPSKIALRLEKVCYRVSLCENCQRQSCKSFIGRIQRSSYVDYTDSVLVLAKKRKRSMTQIHRNTNGCKLQFCVTLSHDFVC